MRTSALFGAKNSRILKSMCVRTDKGVEPVRTFYGQGGRGLIFRDFFADDLYGLLIQGYNNVTKARVKPRLCDYGRRISCTPTRPRCQQWNMKLEIQGSISRPLTIWMKLL